MCMTTGMFDPDFNDLMKAQALLEHKSIRFQRIREALKYYFCVWK
jgi:hypothetical protein